VAWIKLDEYTAKALEKGLGTAIKKDLRFTDYGPDNKKATAGDNQIIGTVAFVALNDPKNEDPDIAKIGTVTELFYNCVAGSPDRCAWFTTTANIGNAVVYAQTAVESKSMIVANLLTKCPTAN